MSVWSPDGSDLYSTAPSSVTGALERFQATVYLPLRLSADYSVWYGADSGMLISLEDDVPDLLIEANEKESRQLGRGVRIYTNIVVAIDVCRA